MIKPDSNRCGHSRRLILHADDFGMSFAVNRGILCGFADGLLTSTSVLANAPAVADAFRGWSGLQSRHAQGQLPSREARHRFADPAQPFDLGVHLNLTQGRPITGRHFPADLLDRDGRFVGVFRLLPRLLSISRRSRILLADELRAQVERVLDYGVAPTHLNGHQYVEMLPVIADLIPELLDRYRIGAVRVAWESHLTRTTLVHRFLPAQWGLAQVKRLFAFRLLLRTLRGGTSHPMRYFGTAHAGRIDLPLLAEFIAASGPGVTEIGVHPGTVAFPDDPPATDGWHDPLAILRSDELEWLTSPALIELLSNHSIALARLNRIGPAQSQQAAA